MVQYDVTYVYYIIKVTRWEESTSTSSIPRAEAEDIHQLKVGLIHTGYFRPCRATF